MQTVEVYRAVNGLQAHLVRTMLTDAGIRAEVTGETLQFVLGDVPGGWATAPAVLVDVADAEHARQIIEQWEQHPFEWTAADEALTQNDSETVSEVVPPAGLTP